MRRRVTEHIPPAEEQRQIKLGRGGLRDVEFTVQLLQLVHGKSDESLRRRDTTSAIAALSAGGYIGRADAAAFDNAYRYLRLLEHRIQLFQLRRTHLMPVGEPALRALAKAVLGPFSNERPHPDALLAAWQKTKRSVRELHERIFYRPLLNTAAKLSSEDAKLTPEAAQGRLAALGYLDPQGAMRHIEALTAGVSRRAALQRQLLPILLDWLAEGRGSRRRTPRLPPRQRSPGHHPLVPGHAPGLQGGGRTVMPRALQLEADRRLAGSLPGIRGVARP
jgi:glutamate-ammonia-ligase adenylyltransferase